MPLKSNNPPILDLFGQPLTEPLPPLSKQEKRRRAERPKGYARPPGTGPTGETCRTCQHACKIHHHDRHYYKCGILQWRWTNGPGTDIRLKSPACEFWQVRTVYQTGDIVRVTAGVLSRSRRCRIVEATCSPAYYLVAALPHKSHEKTHAIHIKNLRLIRSSQL